MPPDNAIFFHLTPWWKENNRPTASTAKQSLSHQKRTRTATTQQQRRYEENRLLVSSFRSRRSRVGSTTCLPIGLYSSNFQFSSNDCNAWYHQHVQQFFQISVVELTVEAASSRREGSTWHHLPPPVHHCPTTLPGRGSAALLESLPRVKVVFSWRKPNSSFFGLWILYILQFLYSVLFCRHSWMKSCGTNKISMLRGINLRNNHFANLIYPRKIIRAFRTNCDYFAVFVCQNWLKYFCLFSGKTSCGDQMMSFLWNVIVLLYVFCMLMKTLIASLLNEHYSYIWRLLPILFLFAIQTRLIMSIIWRRFATSVPAATQVILSKYLGVILHLFTSLLVFWFIGLIYNSQAFQFSRAGQPFGQWVNRSKSVYSA